MKRLEPDAGKLASPVLRGERCSNALFLPDQKCLLCHDTRRLMLTRRSDWSFSIERMQEYMHARGIPRLMAGEKAALVQYFNSYYGYGR